MDASRPRAAGGWLTRLALFFGVSALSGLLVAGVALPVFGGVGLAARNGTNSFESLPAELEIPPLPERSRILAADGSLIATFYQENRISVALSDVAPVMRQAVVAIEDSRFYQHGGIDLRGTVRALVNNSSGKDVQGGSTLTQQYVKQVLLESAANIEDPKKRAASQKAATEQSYTRKIRELRYAVALEEKYSKPQILERYLNIAYFGSQAYGVEAAAKRYYNVHASQLTLPQAAMLAGIVQQPTAFDPLLNPDRATVRRNTVLARMGEVGVASASDVAAAQAAPLGLSPAKRAFQNGCNDSKVAFFCDFVLRTIQNDKVFGATKTDRVRLLLRGGLTIKTTLDPLAQASAQQSLAQTVYPTDKVVSALTSVQPGTGQVKAMAVSRAYGDKKNQIKFNPATDSAYGGSNGFQAGSTFKVFVAAAALEAGYPFNYPINSPYKKVIGDVAWCGGTLTDAWEPTNESSSENGTYTLQSGLASSVNTYFAQLEERVGVCRPAQLARALGVTQADGKPLQQIKSFTLGTNLVSPLSMAEAYATFAARGLHCNSIPILSVTDPTGKQLPVPEAACRQVIEPQIADGMNQLMQGVMQFGTGAPIALTRPSAGKTGTTDDRIAAWFVGSTPDLTSAVWAGNPSPPKGGYPLRNVVIGGKYYAQVYGYSLSGQIWHDMMTKTLANTPVSTFATPGSDVVAGSGDSVPSVSGQSVDQAKATLRAAGFSPIVSSSRVFVTYAPAGAVAYSYPGTGAKAYQGQQITIYVSAGPPAAPPTASPATGGVGVGNGNGNGNGKTKGP